MNIVILPTRLLALSKSYSWVASIRLRSVHWLCVCVCVCVCDVYNHFPRPFHEKLRFICFVMFGHAGCLKGCEWLVQCMQRPCMASEHVRKVLSWAVRGTVLGEMFTSAVWWVNETLSDWRVLVSAVWYRVDMLRFDKLRVEFRNVSQTVSSRVA